MTSRSSCAWALFFLGAFSLITVSSVRAADPVQKKDAETTAATKPATEARVKRLSIVVPFDDKAGMPIAVIMEDTFHDCGDFWARSIPGKPHKYGTIVEPFFAVWASGKVRWKTEEGEYIEGHVSADAVKKVLASIETKKYNTPENAKRSHEGNRLFNEDQDFWIVFVSKGPKENVLMTSFIHAWREETYALQWDWQDLEKMPKPLHLWSDTRTWEEFQKEVDEKIPDEHLPYLRDWDSIKKKLLTLTPKQSESKKIDLYKTKQICYFYRFDEKTSQWVQEKPVCTGKLIKHTDGTETIGF